jgi:hypothetical protein
MTNKRRSAAMPTIKLKLSEAESQKLIELADLHGEDNVEDTLRLLIRYGFAGMQRFVEEDFGQNGEKAPPRGPEPDAEIPM